MKNYRNTFFTGKTLKYLNRDEKKLLVRADIPEEYEQEQYANGGTEVSQAEDKIYIKITGQITRETYEEILPTILNIVTNKWDMEIIMFIDSIGGDLDSTLNIVRLLRSIDNNIITIAFNNCASSACLLFALGTERYMLSNTRYILHQIKSRPTYNDDYFRIDQYMDMADNLKSWEEQYKEVLLSGSKIPKNVLNKVFKSATDTKFGDELILKYNIATKVFTKFSQLDI